MSLTASATITVSYGSVASATVTETVQPPAGVGTGARGRLVHPTLYPDGYDYPTTPTSTINVESVASPAPTWLHSPTLSGVAATKWDGAVAGTRVIERWAEGDVGSILTHLGALWTIFASPPATDENPVIWTPNYAILASYYVQVVAVRSNGELGYALDRRLAGFGYAPSPVELELRVISLVDA
jgi:hypothetical protein